MKKRTNHKYLRKYRGKGGKWIYIYKEGKKKDRTVKVKLTKYQQLAIDRVNENSPELTLENVRKLFYKYFIKNKRMADYLKNYKKEHGKDLITTKDFYKLGKFFQKNIGTDILPVYILRKFKRGDLEKSSSYKDLVKTKRMKNQLELGKAATSNGSLIPAPGDLRDYWERRSFYGAFQENPEYKKLLKRESEYFTKKLGRERPIYGYMSLHNSSMDFRTQSQYGFFKFRVKPEIVEKYVTFTPNNSSDSDELNRTFTKKNPYYLLEYIMDSISNRKTKIGIMEKDIEIIKNIIKTGKIDAPKETFDNLATFFRRYVESQLIGDATLDKFEYVAIEDWKNNENLKRYYGSDYIDKEMQRFSPKILKQIAKELGIPVKIEGGNK